MPSPRHHQNTAYGTTQRRPNPVTALLRLEPPPWVAKAACGVRTAPNNIKPDDFHPLRGQTTNSLRAKQLCAECPVKTECLQYALEMDERTGIWGGLGQEERKPFHREYNRRTLGVAS